jgi:hypothetical protein
MKILYNILTLFLINFSLSSMQLNNKGLDKQECLICFTEKTYLQVCSHNHKLCIACFNNALVTNCPFCREEIVFNKLSTCQKCHQKGHNVKFRYCKDCEHSVVLCKDCLVFPCCKAQVIENPLMYGAYIKRIQESYIDYFYDRTLEKKKNELAPLEQNFKLLLAQMKKLINEKPLQETSLRHLDNQRILLLKQIDQENNKINQHYQKNVNFIREMGV